MIPVMWSIVLGGLAAVAGLRPTAPAELALAERIARRDVTALRQLYSLYSPRVMALAKRVLGSNAEAEDVVQETFVKVWEHAGAFQADRGSVASWVFGIARNASIDRLRRRKGQRVAELPAELPDTARSVLEQLEQRDAREKVREALASLSPEQRESIELAYYEGLTQKQIAERTQTPLGTVKGRIRDGLLKLARHLQLEGAVT